MSNSGKPLGYGQRQPEAETEFEAVVKRTPSTDQSSCTSKRSMRAHLGKWINCPSFKTTFMNEWRKQKMPISRPPRPKNRDLVKVHAGRFHEEDAALIFQAIKYWGRIVNEGEACNGIESCPLCSKHHRNYVPADDCRTCPIVMYGKEVKGQDFYCCNKTPYHLEWRGHLGPIDSERQWNTSAANSEILFLLGVYTWYCKQLNAQQEVEARKAEVAKRKESLRHARNEIMAPLAHQLEDVTKRVRTGLFKHPEINKWRVDSTFPYYVKMQVSVDGSPPPCGCINEDHVERLLEAIEPIAYMCKELGGVRKGEVITVASHTLRDLVDAYNEFKEDEDA